MWTFAPQSAFSSSSFCTSYSPSSSLPPRPQFCEGFFDKSSSLCLSLDAHSFTFRSTCSAARLCFFRLGILIHQIKFAHPRRCPGSRNRREGRARFNMSLWPLSGVWYSSFVCFKPERQQLAWAAPSSQLPAPSSRLPPDYEAVFLLTKDNLLIIAP